MFDAVVALEESGTLSVESVWLAIDSGRSSISPIPSAVAPDANVDAATTRQVMRQYPGSMAAHRWQAASLGQLGRETEARGVLRSFLTMSPFSANQFVKRAPFFRVEDYEHMIEGLHKAGCRDQTSG